MTYVYEVLLTTTEGHRRAYVVVVPESFESTQPYELEVGHAAIADAKIAHDAADLEWRSRTTLVTSGERLDCASAELLILTAPAS